MTLTDLKTLEKAQQLALKHGGFENAVKIYGDYVSGDNLISGEYAFDNKNEIEVTVCDCNSLYQRTSFRIHQNMPLILKGYLLLE